ncbi:MAG: tripartite tricarboxylate transporter substrate binding protein [Alphaproteobacteria bacterium]|nr:tripartite tricarboxylate transporter substrate binding protein [Alphaproteobacteria bacterium]
MTKDITTSRRGLLRVAGMAAGAAIIGGGSAPAAAQQQRRPRFPSRELSWLIYQAPGGSIDLTSRTIQPFLAEQGVRTNLEYAVGAGGKIARTRVYRARADGYTIMTESSPGAVMDEIIGGAEYKALEFEPIFGWTIIGWQFCVKKDSPIRTFRDFVEETKKRRVVVGTIGRGGSSHLQVAIVQKRLGLNFDIIHFDGSGRAYPAVMGGHVDVVCSGPASGSRNRENLHFLGLTKAEPSLPDVQTLAQQGFPQVESADQIWFAKTSPKVPLARVQRLEEAFRKAFEKPDLIERMRRAGEFVTPISRSRMQELLRGHYRMIQENKGLLTSA